MMKRNKTANRVSFLKDHGIGLLILMVSAGVALAQYNPPGAAVVPYNPGGSYKQPYHPPIQTRDLLQSDVKNCTDLHCGMEQCCVETPRAAVCIELTIVNETSNERMCVRPKLCYDETDCYNGACCVYSSYVTSDTTCPGYPDYGKYPPNSQPGQIVLPLFGICLPTPNAVDAICHISITDNPLCPCGRNVTTDGAILTCLPDFAGSSTGTCQVVGGSTTDS